MATTVMDWNSAALRDAMEGGMSHEEESWSERERQGREVARSDFGLDHNRLNSDQAYRESYFQEKQRIQEEWDSHNKPTSWLTSSDSSSTYSAPHSRQSSKGPASGWSDIDIEELFRLALLAFAAYVAYMVIVGVLKAAGHVAEPLVAIVWRPLHAQDLVPENSFWYWTSYLAALAGLWVITATLLLSEFSFLRFSFIALSATVVLELSRIAVCNGSDPALASLYQGSGPCSMGVWSSLIAETTRSVFIHPLIDAVGLYALGALFVTGFVLLPGLAIGSIAREFAPVGLSTTRYGARPAALALLASLAIAFWNPHPSPSPRVSGDLAEGRAAATTPPALIDDDTKSINAAPTTEKDRAVENGLRGELLAAIDNYFSSQSNIELTRTVNAFPYYVDRGIAFNAQSIPSAQHQRFLAGEAEFVRRIAASKSPAEMIGALKESVGEVRYFFFERLFRRVSMAIKHSINQDEIREAFGRAVEEYANLIKRAKSRTQFAKLKRANSHLSDGQIVNKLLGQDSISALKAGNPAEHWLAEAKMCELILAFEALAPPPGEYDFPHDQNLNAEEKKNKDEMHQKLYEALAKKRPIPIPEAKAALGTIGLGDNCGWLADNMRPQ